MPPADSQAFLRELDKKLWTAADRLRSNLDAAAKCFPRDQHPDLRADFVMANPPFNIKEWWDGKREGDARWNRSKAESASHAKLHKNRCKSVTPTQGNANFAWANHMLHHLEPNGSIALLLANGSMSSNSNGEGDIHRALTEADLVECMVALPELWN